MKKLFIALSLIAIVSVPAAFANDGKEKAPCNKDKACEKSKAACDKSKAECEKSKAAAKSDCKSACSKQAALKKAQAEKK